MHNSCSNKCRSQSNMKVNIIIISPICCVTCIEIFEWKNYNVVWCAIYWQVFSEMESVSLMLLVVWQRYCRELILFAQITTSMRASVLKIRKIAIVEVDGDVYASFELESLMQCTDDQFYEMILRELWAVYRGEVNLLGRAELVIRGSFLIWRSDRSIQNCRIPVWIGCMLMQE